MITVKIIKNNDFRSVEITGHAGYNPGNDVVCSAVSVLICALKGWLEIHPQNLKKVKTMKAENGNAEIATSGNRDFLAAFEVLDIGLRLLALHFPDYVKVSTLESRDT